MHPDHTTNEIPYGYCQCGCGQLTPLATKTNTKNGLIKGQPCRFVRGHTNRSRFAPTVPRLCECGCGLPAPIAKRSLAKLGHVKGQPVRFIIGHHASIPVEKRFWEHVTPGPFDECWIWRGYIANLQGYGAISVAHHWTSVHRFSWQLHNGPIPDGLQVLHKCDNPPCVNPYHLFLGTQSDNIRDMHAKGRNVGKSKLTKEQVREIRRRFDRGEKQADLARAYGITLSNAHDIVRRVTWRHI